MSMTVSPESSIPQSGRINVSRRFARQLALQMLFQHEFQDQDPSWQDKFWSSQSTSREVRAFTSFLVEGALEHKEEIDELIRHFAVDWSLERMPVVDRNILRCAIFELLWAPDIPAMATINEAIELAKLFADDEAKKFVNGLLDHVLRVDLRLQEKRKHLQQTTFPAE